MLNKPLDLEIPHLTCLLNVVTLLTVQSLLSVRSTVQEIGQWCCFERLWPSLKASCECANLHLVSLAGEQLYGHGQNRCNG